MSWDSFNPAKITATLMAAGQQAMNAGFQSVNSALKLGEALSKAKTPTDVADAVASYHRRHFEMLGEVFRSVTEVGLEAASKVEKWMGAAPGHPWRFVQTPSLAKASGMGVWADCAARMAHALLCVRLIAAPPVGPVTLFADGRPLPFFGVPQTSPSWAKDKSLERAAKQVHEWLANGLSLLAGFHAGAALAHDFGLPGNTLERMPRAWNLN